MPGLPIAVEAAATVVIAITEARGLAARDYRICFCEATDRTRSGQVVGGGSTNGTCETCASTVVWR